jgi:pimeloyl-ACP methyl ester carboxylesterase
MAAKAQKLKLASGELTWHALGEGRPLLYLHPAGGVRWTGVLEGLAASHKVHVPVVPGYDGTAPHASLDSMQKLAKAIGEFADQAIGQRCDVIGHSFGGWLALWLAVERPDLVDHLVLESPAGLRRGPAPATRVLYAHPDKAGPSGKSSEIEAANGTAGARYHHNSQPDEPLVARLGEVDAMTLILQGSEDRIVPMESVQRLKGALKKAYLVYVWDAGHAMEVDQPDRVLTVIDDFLMQSEAFVVNWGSLARDPG